MSGTTHEDFTRTALVRGTPDRSFGLVFVAVFCLIGLAPLRRHHEIRLWALAAAAILLALSLAAPGILRPANRVWTKLSLLLNRIVNPVAMGAIFFLVAVPTGVLVRWMGKDPLRLRLDPSADSYWRCRAPGPAPDTMANQF